MEASGSSGTGHQHYDPGSGPACRQCSSSSTVRWPHRNGTVYCLACWKAWGSEAANVLELLAAEPALAAPPWGSLNGPLYFPEPPVAEPDAKRGRPADVPAGARVCEVTPEDSLEAAARLLRERGEAASALPPVVLDMANKDWLGGGFLSDCSGQEEELVRRTNLYWQLVEADRAGCYPIPELGAIVLPEVVVFRGGGEGSFTFLPESERFRVSVVTAAAPVKPEVSTAEGREAYMRRMSAKVDALLATLQHIGYTELVLSAWGCGAFRNPPQEVAQIFAEALRHRFAGAFRRVVFAIYDRKSWGESNCQIFARELAGLP